MNTIRFHHNDGTRLHASASESPWRQRGNNIVDLLRTAPSPLSFVERVEALRLSTPLEQKALKACSAFPEKSEHCSFLSENEERELATEVLLLRHRFTRLVFEHRIFRQAALTILQNIYLFRQRKIFFNTYDLSPDQERQEALLLFSGSSGKTTIPLAKTFQHMILARVWDRIIGQADDALLESDPFRELHEVVEKLNCLRNIYMLLCTGLVRKLTTKIGRIYRQSISGEDARQIGSFGIARAAYRYHPSSGFRFSTYATRWIGKEIQRQSLENRLIRISANLVERISHAARHCEQEAGQSAILLLNNATPQASLQDDGLQPTNGQSPLPGPEACYEQKEICHLLMHVIDEVLSPKSGDIIKRRYGLGCYRGRQQSVVEIGRIYGVTRSSIYQHEQSAIKVLRKHLAQHFDERLPAPASFKQAQQRSTA